MEVREGDTLHSFARKYLKDAADWPKIYELNNSTIKNPNIIYPGQIVLVPIEMLKEKVGDLTGLEKSVKIKKIKKDWRPGEFGERLFPEEGIQTGEKAFARVDFLAGGSLKVYEHSLVFLKHAAKKNAVASLLGGGINAEKIKVVTPAGEVNPQTEESEYDVAVEEDNKTKVSVHSGEVKVKPQITGVAQWSKEVEEKAVIIKKGYRTIVKPEKEPEAPKLLPESGEKALQNIGMAAAGKEIKFLLQVSKSDNFKIILKHEEAYDLSPEYIEKELSPGRYYWRAAVMDNDGFSGAFSKPRSFVIKTSDPFVELYEFEESGHNRSLLKVNGYAMNVWDISINNNPATMTESGELEALILLPNRISMVAGCKEGVIIKKYHKKYDEVWVPAGDVFLRR
ncbi:MAG: LysM peptidoglycan-binding domain-containing protein [Elusimicrobiota bacterium]